jgi:hypothetical protein
LKGENGGGYGTHWGSRNTTSLGKPYSGAIRESVEEEDQEIPGRETLLLRWR